MCKITETARGKINLFLEITGKRTDGYHNIEGVMTEISLADTVFLEKTETAGISLECNFEDGADFAPLRTLGEKSNLAFRAAELFLSELEKAGSAPKEGVKITIEKKIPVCAGLAGGSADAAAVMRGMNRLFGMPFDTDALCRAGAALGADVPFCIRGKTCLCRGTGELLTAVKTDLRFHGLISVEKKKKASTAAAYAEADALPGRRIKSADKMLKALSDNSLPEVVRRLYNIFEEACSYGDRAARIMREGGASGVLMSGAGPAFFGLFEDENKKFSAKCSLENEGYTVYEF